MFVIQGGAHRYEDVFRFRGAAVERAISIVNTCVVGVGVWGGHFVDDGVLYCIGRTWTFTMGRSSCGTCMIVSATILGPIVMVLLAVSFATDFWQEFDVDVRDLSVNNARDRSLNPALARNTHDRHRGMWRECYPGNDTRCKWKGVRVGWGTVPRSGCICTRTLRARYFCFYVNDSVIWWLDEQVFLVTHGKHVHWSAYSIPIL